MSHSQPLYHILMRRLLLILAGFVASLVSAASGYAQQVVYYSPVVAQPTPYVARYTPSGTYSAVTAYSPPVAAAVPRRRSSRICRKWPPPSGRLGVLFRQELRVEQQLPRGGACQDDYLPGSALSLAALRIEW